MAQIQLRRATGGPWTATEDRMRGSAIPFADLEGHLKLDVVEEERFQTGALAQVLVPKR